MKYLLLVVSIFGLDEGIKQRIDKKEPLGKERRVPKLPVVIEKYYNNGAALNLLAKKPKIMLGLHSACMAGLMTIYGFVLRKGNTGLKTGMSMMVGGGLSNLWDRIHKKHVVDYIRFDTPWKRFSRIVFNISDSSSMRFSKYFASIPSFEASLTVNRILSPYPSRRSILWFESTSAICL